MAISNKPSASDPVVRETDLAQHAESTASLFHAFAEDAARHHDFPLAADYDVRAIVFGLRARFHRLVAGTGKEHQQGSKRKEL